MDRWDVSSDDLDGVVEFPRSIEGVRMALLFREIAQGRVKVSLRSVGDVDVAAFAKHFGGGGHTKAAGLSLEGSLAEVQAIVLARGAGLSRRARTSVDLIDCAGTYCRMTMSELNVTRGDASWSGSSRRSTRCGPTSRRIAGTSRSSTSMKPTATLLLRLGGTCHGCSASSITLKQGIEVRLRQAVPEVKVVESV